MDSFDIVIGAALAVLALFQIWLTSRIWKSDIYDGPQKFWQTQLIWFVPILGAGIVLHMLREDARAMQ